MEKESMSGFTFHSYRLLALVWKKRMPLLLFSLLAAVVSIVVSLMIVPRYESTVVLYPSSSASVSEALVSSSPFATNEILAFGEEQEVERTLQILYSDLIRERLVQQFDLFNHYRIRPASRYRYTDLYDKIKRNISFHKTEFMSIEIRVLDEDPQIAADMANTIASLLDSAINQMQKQKAVDAFDIVKKEYLNLQAEIVYLEDSAKKFPGDGTQEFVRLENERLSQLKAKYLQAKVDAEQALPHTFVVSKAYAAEKKATPKRSLIVGASILSTFLLVLVVLAIAESIRQKQ
jgi:uncharacterized protein involved in exopolysaccharide biosynthesis